MKKGFFNVLVFSVILLAVFTGCKNSAESNPPPVPPPSATGVVIKGTFAVNGKAGTYEVTLGEALRAAYNATGRAVVDGKNYDINTAGYDAVTGDFSFIAKNTDNSSFAVEAKLDSSGLAAGTVKEKDSSGAVVATGSVGGIKTTEPESVQVKNYEGIWDATEIKVGDAVLSDPSITDGKFNATIDSTTHKVSGSYSGTLSATGMPATRNYGTFSGDVSGNTVTVQIKAIEPAVPSTANASGTITGNTITGAWENSVPSTSFDSKGTWNATEK